MNSENSSSGSFKPVIPVILGPTASGKSEAAVKLAKRIDGEIISADSMQIYQEMQIGTARPTKEEMEGVPHHLVGFVRPDEPFTVADFRKEAYRLIDAILSCGKVPVICGGTGLYINSLIYPYDLEKDNTDPKIRKRLEKEAQTNPDGLYRRLQKVDPVSAEKIHKNNTKRVIRALEIFEATGKTKSEQDEEGREKVSIPYVFKLFMPFMDREELYRRIDKRVDRMIEKGLLVEAEKLDQKYDRSLVSMQAIGYKELYPYFDGNESLEEAIRILKRDTRHFAKRQMTWFRRMQGIEPVEDLNQYDFRKLNQQKED